MANNFKHSSKVFGIILTAFIITLLVLVGPAQAFSLGLDKPKDSYKQGEVIKTVGVINVNPDEFYNAQKTGFVELRIDGPGGDRICKFRLNGAAVSGCDGIKIKLNKSTVDDGYGYLFPGGYGYGYGVTDGKLVYTFEIDTTNFLVGKYGMQLRAGGIKSKTQNFMIMAKPNDDKPKETPKPDKITICHIPEGHPENKHTLQISPSALQNHLQNHGDTLGPCPETPAV